MIFLRTDLAAASSFVILTERTAMLSTVRIVPEGTEKLSDPFTVKVKSTPSLLVTSIQSRGEYFLLAGNSVSG